MEDRRLVITPPTTNPRSFQAFGRKGTIYENEMFDLQWREIAKSVSSLAMWIRFKFDLETIVTEGLIPATCAPLLGWKYSLTWTGARDRKECRIESRQTGVLQSPIIVAAWGLQHTFSPQIKLSSCLSYWQVDSFRYRRYHTAYYTSKPKYLPLHCHSRVCNSSLSDPLLV